VLAAALMAGGESHAPGRMTFAVTKSAAASLRVGEPVGTGADLHGDPITGRVVEIKPGNMIVLVIVESDDA
jgi:hypothetical protein